MTPPLLPEPSARKRDAAASTPTLLVDAVALESLRSSLIETIGVAATRRLFIRFGFTQGWRAAMKLRATLRTTLPQALAVAATRTQLESFFTLDPDAVTIGDSVRLKTSWEARTRPDEGVDAGTRCWVAAGLLSGVMSAAMGTTHLATETQCASQGGDECRLTISNAPESELGLEALGRTLGHTTYQAQTELADADGFVTSSDTKRKLLALARRIAPVDSTILLTGESGVGKERIARLVHFNSSRANGPFVAVNCGAITETLLESELFGHVRGSYTGATTDRPGLFEAAHLGTLLLDEIGEVSASLQVKLLRALQEREVRRVGDNKSRKIDVRIIAATNRDLHQRVIDGAFRQDLYYRLKVIELHVPSLRERRDDILPLARTLLDEAAVRLKRQVRGLSIAAADQLLRYDWPGNVRELENVMERAVAVTVGGRVDFDDLPDELRRGFLTPRSSVVGGVQPLDEVERQYILAALALNEGNQTRTAEQLRIGSATLYRKLKRYGLSRRKPAPR